MKFTSHYKNHTHEIVGCFQSAFADSEGPEEGELIGSLAHDLLNETADPDIFVFTAWENGAAVAAIIFTRINFDEDPRTIFILSPVAVATAHQGRGIGQSILKHGLEVLQEKGVDIALTYGDPAYYGKVGFAQITPAQAQPPMPLSYPHGWLGQSLVSTQFEPLKGRSTCVAALSRPEYW